MVELTRLPAQVCSTLTQGPPSKAHRTQPSYVLDSALQPCCPLCMQLSAAGFACHDALCAVCANCALCSLAQGFNTCWHTYKQCAICLQVQQRDVQQGKHCTPRTQQPCPPFKVTQTAKALWPSSLCLAAALLDGMRAPPHMQQQPHNSCIARRVISKR